MLIIIMIRYCKSSETSFASVKAFGDFIFIKQRHNTVKSFYKNLQALNNDYFYITIKHSVTDKI